jgi:hypothetical protein
LRAPECDGETVSHTDVSIARLLDCRTRADLAARQRARSAVIISRLLVRRISPDDGRQGAITLSVDDHPVQAQLRYGKSVTVFTNAGAHLVTTSNNWFVPHLMTDVQPGSALAGECGLGTRSRL